MHQPTLSRRAVRRAVLAAGTALLLSLSVVVGTAGAASASGYRTWTISGVTFDDGGQMSGSFRLGDTGEMSAVHVTTSGGNEGVFGASTTYDNTNSRTMGGFEPNQRIVVFENLSRYVLLSAGDLTVAEDGDVRTLDNASYECDNCGAVRRVTTGTLVAGTFVDTSQVTLAGTPGIIGMPRVGQTLTGDDSGMTTSPPDAARSYQWLRDGAPIAGQNGTTYTATVDDIGATLSFRVGATKDGHPDATPVDSAGIGPIEDLPSTPLPSTPISVSVPSGLHLGGQRVRVTATGLEANESYTVRIGGVTIGSGAAPASGVLSRRLVVPNSIGDRRAAVRVAGTNRAGAATLRVVQARRLGLVLARPALHKRQLQAIRVTGLAAGERVTVKYRNGVVSPAMARATAAGGYQTVVRVGRLAGTKTITVTGEFGSRFAVRTCQVTRR